MPLDERKRTMITNSGWGKRSAVNIPVKMMRSRPLRMGKRSRPLRMGKRGKDSLVKFNYSHRNG